MGKAVRSSMTSAKANLLTNGDEKVSAQLRLLAAIEGKTQIQVMSHLVREEWKRRKLSDELLKKQA